MKNARAVCGKAAGAGVRPVHRRDHPDVSVRGPAYLHAEALRVVDDAIELGHNHEYWASNHAPLTAAAKG